MGLEDFGLGLGGSNPDFVKLAESFGAAGHRVTEHGQFLGLMQHCLGRSGVHVIEVPIEYTSSSHLQVRFLTVIARSYICLPWTGSGPRCWRRGRNQCLEFNR